jgi:hypothetical protein
MELHFTKRLTKLLKPLSGICLAIFHAEDTTVAMQDIDYDVTSVKQITAKRPTPGEGVTHTSLPLFQLTITRNQKASEIFKLATICNIVIKVEVHRSQNGLAQCYNCHVLATSGCTAGSFLTL